MFELITELQFAACSDGDLAERLTRFGSDGFTRGDDIHTF
jgi:hypothetical protein